MIFLTATTEDDNELRWKESQLSEDSDTIATKAMTDKRAIRKSESASNPRNGVSSPRNGTASTNSHYLLRSLFVFILGSFFGMQVINVHVAHESAIDASTNTNKMNQPSLKDHLLKREEVKAIVRDELQAMLTKEKSLQLATPPVSPVAIKKATERPSRGKKATVTPKDTTTPGFTKEDWIRNQLWKSRGRDWRLTDEEEQSEWRRMAKEQEEAVGEPVQVYDNVALVTKVHSAHPFIGSVVQNVCLMNAAYNFRRNYPWIIFSTLPWHERDLKRAQQWAAPGNLTVVVDSEPLEDILASMSESDREHLTGRCDCCHKATCCKKNSTLAWDWWCHEEGKGHATLSYLWQAEFRATHLWMQSSLKDIKHMIWIDNDAMPTKPWPKDPMTTMVENDLVVMFDNFPQGTCKNDMLVEKMNLAYNKSVCAIHMTEEGHFRSVPCKPDQNRLSKFGLIHGMFHITNLDHYRLPINLEMNRLLTQHKGYRYSRQWDDQIAVTVVPAVTAPERAWDMRRNGFNMSMTHNGNLDGKEKNTKWAYRVWWKYYNHTWPLASRMCSDVITFNG